MPNLKFDLPKNQSSIIKVLGIGGGGSNAVSYMYQQGIRDVDFIVCNTDAQSLERSPVPTKIQLGITGLGAGSMPEIGRQATLENIEKIIELLEVNTRMLFITAGMGGGTGTGGAPVIAEKARSMNILTVGIVTLPFSFEGRKRRLQAEQGISEMRKYVDTLLVINNDKLRELHGDLKLSAAFGMTDEILTTAARGIAEIITVPGYINVDFEDVNTVMKNSGKALLGSGKAEGDNRALRAVEAALMSPLLDDNNIKGADNILLYIGSGTEEISMDEVTVITDYIQTACGQSAEIIWGNGTDESLGNKVAVTVIATGFDAKKAQGPEKTIVGSLFSHERDYQSQSNAPKSEIPQTEVKNEAPDQKATTHGKCEQPLQTVIFEIQQPVDEIAEKSFEPEFKVQMQSINSVKSEVEQKESVSETFSPFESVRKNTTDYQSGSSDEKNEVGSPKMAERIQKLKELSQKMKTSAGLSELERQPAYVRRNVELKDPPPHGTTEISRFTLKSDEDNRTELRENNSYLHDNVD